MKIRTTGRFLEDLAELGWWGYRLRDSWQMLRYYLFRKSRWAYVPTPKLTPGYQCQDTRLLHACMQMVVDYVDEATIETTRWRADPDTYRKDFVNRDVAVKHAAEYSTILKIHDYWVRGRAVLREESIRAWDAYNLAEKVTFVKGSDGLYDMVVVPNPGYTAESAEELKKVAVAAETKFDDTEDEMMADLVKIRRRLWV